MLTEHSAHLIVANQDSRNVVVRCASSTAISTRGCHWFARLLEHACEQWHASRNVLSLSPVNTVNCVQTRKVFTVDGSTGDLVQIADNKLEVAPTCICLIPSGSLI
jgi:hypothetical protein